MTPKKNIEGVHTQEHNKQSTIKKIALQRTMKVQHASIGKLLLLFTLFIYLFIYSLFRLEKFENFCIQFNLVHYVSWKCLNFV